MLWMVKGSLLVLTVSFGASAWADNCTLALICDTDTTCGPNEMRLEWSGDVADGVTIDGVAYATNLMSDPTAMGEIRTSTANFQVRMSGPMVTVLRDQQTILITPAETQGDVTVNLLEIPKRYVDYDEAMKNRQVFAGHCEGLF